MVRGRAYTRDMAWRKARRKRRIAREVYHGGADGWEYYNNLHQYSKNKIHCSCPICSAKTKNKGFRKKHLWAPSYNPKTSERRRVDFQESSIEELDEIQSNMNIVIPVYY